VNSSEFEYTLSDLSKLPSGGPPPVIQNFVHAEQLTIIHGPPEAGKTYWAVLMSIMGSAGGNWGEFSTPGKLPVRCIYVLTDGSKYDMNERIEYGLTVWPNATDNFKAYIPPTVRLRSERSIQDLIDVCAGYDVVFLDSLSSMLGGDVSKQSDIDEGFDGIRRLKMAHPKRGVVLIHHDHRTKYDYKGNKIDEGGKAYAGSYMIEGHADIMWHMTRNDPGRSAAAKLDMSKGRSRFINVDSFYVHMDPKTGAMSTQGYPETIASSKVRLWISSIGHCTTQDVVKWGKTNKVSRSAVFRYLRDLAKEGIVTSPKRGEYKWVDLSDDEE
jgi:hypothetical protein